MAPFVYCGRLQKDLQTKQLVRRLQPGDIALVEHADLDQLAAESLIRRRVRVILNTEPFCRGIFPPLPVEMLLKRNVYLIQNVNRELFDLVAEGDKITIRGGAVYFKDEEIGRGEVVTQEHYGRLYRQFGELQPQVVDQFVINTLSFAYRERALITEHLAVPPLGVVLKGRQVVVVVRGKGYRDDLHAIKSYLQGKTPVLIGVDGGGDALLEFGFRPDILIGDMDSVSDDALRLSRERVVHAYQDGRGVPGRQRLEGLGLPYHILSAPGTSEDIALLAAYEAGASLIVAIGTHFSVVEFLEKGRPGMASTFLTRLKVGDRLVDAKGVSQLYVRPETKKFLPVVVLAGLAPLLVLIICSPLIKHLLQLILLKVRFGL